MSTEEIMVAEVSAEDITIAKTTSSETLKKILARGSSDWISRCAASNYSCPPEALKMVLERGKDDGVSHYASENSNCPPEVKIKWMKKVGKIAKFDPNKHKE